MIQTEEIRIFQRRYPRVFLTGVIREFPFVKNCEVIWPSQFASGIYDVGRSSMTVYFPMRLNLNLSKGDFIKLGLRIGRDSDPIFTDCRVVRSETRLLVFEPLRLSKSQSDTIAKYFSDDVVSQNTHFIEPRFYAPEQTFSHWFHGPRDTNLYIWKTDAEIKRVSLELSSTIYEWSCNGLKMGPSRDTLSYATEDYAYYTNNLVSLTTIPAKSDEALRFKYFVSTLIPAHKVIKDVLNVIE